MSPALIDLKETRGPSSDDVSGLFAYLAQLVGEPFRFARVSYGDELTLHFGDLRPARSPKLKDHPYGSYILGLRGSPWILKSGLDSEPVVLTAGVTLDSLTPAFGQPLRNEELEARRIIEPGSRVTVAAPFVVKPIGGFGLQLRFSDGSSLMVLPSTPDLDETDEADDPNWPELADWELLSPRGLLRAGPGLTWNFTPRAIPRVGSGS
jgi:hypothetical protein